MVRSPVALACAVVAGTTVLWLRFNAEPGETSPAAMQMALFGDLVNYYLGMTELTATRLASGEIPLWNPHACSGIPWLATAQSAVLYPGSWLAMLVPAERAISILMFAECALAGWFSALLFRAWGLSDFAAAIGGITFVFACTLGQTLWPPSVSTLLWMPWLLLCTERFVVEPSRGAWCGLALGVALQALAGFPQYAAYTFLLLVPYAGLRLAEARLRKQLDLRAMGLYGAALCAAVLAGLAAAGAQILPTLELATQSVRGAELTPAEVHYLNVARPHLSQAVLRAAFDPEPRLVAFAMGTSGGYLGIPVLVMLGVGVAGAWQRPLAWLLVAIGGLALVLSDGHLGVGEPLYRLYAGLPFLGSLRTPERLRVLTFFCAIALAAMGFDRVARVQGGRRSLRVALVASSVAVGAAMIALGSAAGAWRVAAALLPAWALLAWPDRTAIRRAAQALLLALVLFDLAYATGEYGTLRAIPGQLARHFHANLKRVPDALVAELRRDVGTGRVALVGYKPFVAAAPSQGLYRISCYEPLTPAQWPALETRLTGRPPRGGALLGVPPDDFPALYDAAGVARILVPKPGGVLDHRNEDALPRAYLVRDYVRASQDEAFDAIANGDPILARSVLLERDPGFEPPEAGGAPVAVSFVEYAPERVVLDVESPGDALLVLTDSHHPGWQVRLDGASREILRANGLYRAVVVPEGQHRVVFEYRPASFRAGRWLSLLGLAVIAAVATAPLWRRRG